MKCLIFFIFCVYAVHYACGEALPERNLIVNKDMRGVILLIAPNRYIYPSRTSGKIKFAKSDHVQLYLQDDPAEDGDKFSPSDVKTLSDQSRQAFQSVTYSRCSSVEKLNKSLSYLGNQLALVHLGFYICDISTDTLIRLTKINNLHSIEFRECNFNDACLLRVLKKSGIRKITINSSDIYRPLSEASTLPKLRTLTINKMEIEKEDLTNIVNNDSLTTLCLNGVDISDKCNNLSKFTLLKFLTISVNDGKINDYSFVKHLTELQSITLIGTGMKNGDFKYIAALPDLENLDLERQGDVITSNMDLIKKMVRLKNISTDTMLSKTVTDELKKINGGISINPTPKRME